MVTSVQNWFIKYVACAQDVGKARPSDAHGCSGRWHCGAPWAQLSPAEPREPSWAPVSPAEPREPRSAPWAPLRPGRRPAPSTRAGPGQGSLPWLRPCALRHRAPAGPQPPWPTEPRFIPQGRSGKSAAPLLDGMRYAPPGCIGALSAERAVASTGNACRNQPLMVLHSKECRIRFQSSLQAFSPNEGSYYVKQETHGFVLRELPGCRKPAIVQSTGLLARQYWPGFWLCCNNLPYFWKLRTTTGQSWFTITFKVHTTKPCWKLNPTCQDPAGYLGIDHFSNRSLNTGY